MYELYLAHHGVKGQKWGVRRYQNKDGSLTNMGRNRKTMVASTALQFLRLVLLANRRRD